MHFFREILIQIHLDQEEAERYGFKAPIAHGMLTMGITSEIASSFTEQGMRISKYEMSISSTNPSE